MSEPDHLPSAIEMLRDMHKDTEIVLRLTGNFVGDLNFYREIHLTPAEVIEILERRAAK